MKKIFFLFFVSLFFLVSCGQTQNPDIINPESDFVYFYGATCPHCQELNKRLSELGMYDLVSIEKRETYYNNANRELFLEVTKTLGIEQDKVWVPFVLDRRTREYAVGVEPALKLFSTRLKASSIDNQDWDNKIEVESDEIISDLQ